MKHAPTVVIVTWQRSEHGYSSLRYETCSVSCHRDMTTVNAWLFILLGMKHAPSVVIVTWQRSEHGNTSLIYETYSVSFIVTWQRSEHGYSSLRYETCPVSCNRDMTTVRAWLFIHKVWNMLVSCHRDMTTVRAWLFISKVWNMLRQLSSWHDNGQSMVIHL